MRGRRRTAAIAAALALGLVGCTPALPETVVPGTSVVVGWTGTFTSSNAAAAPTAGNLDVAAMIRGSFGTVVDGDFVADEGFGTVQIVADDPFTVEYDLAEPAWSDGIPLDAADLLVGWAASAGYFGGSDEETADAAASDSSDVKVPRVDEFARSIEVTFAHPRSDWQSAVSVAVPAHVLAGRALGIDDAMEAKQAVIRAVQSGDERAIAKLAEAWNEGFEVEGAEVSGDLLLSSGPFLVAEIDAEGQSVELVPNSGYRGGRTPQVARVELVPVGDDPVGEVGAALDIVRVTPTAANRQPIRDLERKDFAADPTQDGTIWAALLSTSGIFTNAQVRTAFLHAVPSSALLEGGAGEWRAAYAPTTSMTTSSESPAYEVVSEDSGFAEAIGQTQEDPAVERESAGVADGAPVCVLYDRASEFAVGAFAAMQVAAAEAGWRVVDCSVDDFTVGLEQRRWDAVITRVPLPESPAALAAQWGSDGAQSITRQGDAERDALIAQLAQTTDVYEARELRAQIEASIVRAAVALPIAANPVLTIVDRDVTGVAPGNGSAAALASGAWQWAVAR